MAERLLWKYVGFEVDDINGILKPVSIASQSHYLCLFHSKSAGFFLTFILPLPQSSLFHIQTQTFQRCQDHLKL